MLNKWALFRKQYGGMGYSNDELRQMYYSQNGGGPKMNKLMKNISEHKDDIKNFIKKSHELYQNIKESGGLKEEHISHIVNHVKTGSDLYTKLKK